MYCTKCGSKLSGGDYCNNCGNTMRNTINKELDTINNINCSMCGTESPDGTHNCLKCGSPLYSEKMILADDRLLFKKVNTNIKLSTISLILIAILCVYAATKFIRIDTIDHYKKSQQFAISGNIIEAINEMNIAIDKSPDKYNYYYTRGMLKLAIGDKKSAYQDFVSGCPDIQHDRGDIDCCNMQISMITGVNIDAIIKRSFGSKY